MDKINITSEKIWGKIFFLIILVLCKIYRLSIGQYVEIG